MKFISIVENFNTPLWSYHIKVPAEAAEKFLENGARRVYCKLDGKREFQCAILPNGEGVFFILLNKKIRERLKLHVGGEVVVSLRKDTSKYGLPMPEEFREVLNTDKEGDELFHALTPGKQRSLLHLLGEVKNSEIRIRKSLAVVDHLRRNEGKVLFKQLAEDLKV